MAVEPELVAASDHHRGALVWRYDSEPVNVLSSAPVGGGLSSPDWIVNIGVTRHYRRTDLAEHAAEVAQSVALPGTGVGLFTAAKVDQWKQGSSGAENPVVADATVGVSKPVWAADPSGGWNAGWLGEDRDADPLAPSEGPPAPGTINIVIQVPVVLDPGAAVNAVITATEAKTQAMIEAGIPGTGTASDAVVIVWPATGSVTEPFAGPRSTWGSRIAQATHAAVVAGIAEARP